MKIGRKKDPEKRRWWRRDRTAGIESPTHRPDTEPAHDQPWVPRGLADRIRRSPRQ